MLNQSEKDAHELIDNDVIRICPPGARKINQYAFTDAVWNTMRDAGAPVYLFYPHSTLPSRNSKLYIELGKSQKVHTGYKCSNREPWWRVPILQQPDLIFTYINHLMPRIISNDARVQVSNSVYGITLHRNRKTVGRKALPKLFFNSVSALSSEIEGRSYGGGLLKIEPREADQVLLPSLSLVANLMDEIDAKLISNEKTQASSYAEICKAMDEILLRDASGLSKDAVKVIQTAKNDLFNRRISRTKSAKSLGSIS